MAGRKGTMTTRDETFLIAMGANLPLGGRAPAETLRLALDDLADEGVRVRQVSRFYETPCFPHGDGPDYVNAAARLGFAGAPQALLERLHAIEARHGRRREQRWGRRTLDLDLIAAGARVLPDLATHALWRDLPLQEQRCHAPEHLILPHPRLQERAFVLVPLAEVAPHWRHPVLGQTVLEMLERLGPEAVAEPRPL